MKDQNICRLCGSVELDVCLSLQHSPNNISRLLHPDELAGDVPIDLAVYRCKDCGFTQLSRFLDSGYYDDYLMTVSHSPQMREYQKNQVVKFIEKFDLVGKKVVEVGCGDGHYLAGLNERGVNAVGIEPSRSFRELAIARGLKVFAGYVDTGSPIPEAPYDGFVTRQVLEHVENPDDFLRGIRVSLGEGAVGLIEVPSLEQAIEFDRFYDFFPDHLNYFSSRTLAFVLERNGFIVEEISRGMNGEFLQAFVRVDRVFDFENLQASVDTLSRDIVELMDRCQKQSQRVAIWGSGAKGLVTLAVTRIKGVEYVIDSDPYKQGLYTPVSHLPIVPPARLLEEPVDVVIITAMAYRDEIVEQLRKNLQFTGTIAFLGKRLQFINENERIFPE